MNHHFNSPHSPSEYTFDLKVNVNMQNGHVRLIVPPSAFSNVQERSFAPIPSSYKEQPILARSMPFMGSPALNYHLPQQQIIYS